jgi:septal ring factor EnvC (AmiA/AmiB activator)
MAVQLDSFTKVKEMMDKMLAELKEEQAEEVKFKAYCETELNQNEKTVFDKNEHRKDLETSIQQLTNLIKKLGDEIAEAKAQIANAELEIKKASQDREAENSEFQTVVADQRATQAILSKALQKLNDFYEKGIGNKVALAQRSAQEPPVKFNSYKTNSGSSPAIGLIKQILEDSKALEAETTSGEFKAQADYEMFVRDSNDLIKSLQEAIAAKSKAIATAESDKAEASADHESTVGELESLAAYEADLHHQCDFVLKNFDIRQKARLQEMEAIQAAKAILSGDTVRAR